jgi:hypothetical protein
MLHRKSTQIACVLAALCIVAAASATAASIHSNAFGRGGSTPTLASNCSRLPMYLTPAGKTWDGATPNGKQFTSQALSVVKAQLDCSILRTNRIIKCALTNPVTEAPADKQGFRGESGAAAFVACIGQVTGVKR